jgi:hypothetical protein
MCANEQYKVSKVLRDIAEEVKFWSPKAKALKQLMLRVNRDERLNLSDDILTAASETCDYRAAFNILDARQILHTKEKKISAGDITKNLMNNEPVNIPETGNDLDKKTRIGILYNLDENAPRLYDILDMRETFEIMTKADKYSRRGQISFSNSILKEIPKTTKEIEEIIYPVYYSKNKGKEEPN